LAIYLNEQWEMSIEKDIRQRSFINEYQKGIVNLLFTYSWVNEQLKAIFEKEKLTPQQFNILRILRGSKEPLSTMQIRERMLDKMSDTSRIVDRLVAKGMASKKTSKTDKRLVDICITEAGLQVLAQMDTYQQEIDDILSRLTIDEAAQLNQLLDKLRGSL
jgi:DNA-binding MarR family transcriptional regulator